MSAVKEPFNPESNFLRLGDIYFKFSSTRVVIGKWDEGDIETINLKDIIMLHRYLLHKITKILIKVK